MSYKTSWNVSGTKLDDSAAALTKAVQSVTNGKALKKYESRLNTHFQDNISKNMHRAGMEADFHDVFFLQIVSNNVTFVNTEPLITQRYEYGYYDSSDNEYEDYMEEYAIQTSPRYFIRPAIQESLNEIGELMVNETTEIYMRERRQTNGDDIA